MPTWTTRIPTVQPIHTASPSVYTKSSWSDPWIRQPDIHCEDLTLTVQHTGLSHARLTYAFGYIERHPVYPQVGGNPTARFSLGPQNVLPIFAERLYVKVEVEFPEPVSNWTNHFYIAGAPGLVSPLLESNRFVWIGVIVSTEEAEAALRSDVLPIPGNYSGVQHMTALGMEWFLTRKQLATSWIEDNLNPITGQRETRVIDSGYPVNIPSSNARSGESFTFGTRSPVDYPVPPGVFGGPPRRSYVYAGKNNPHPSSRWTAQQFLIYLRDYQFPTWGNNSTHLQWNLLYDESLDWFEPALQDLHGQTIHDILQQLIVPRRGLTWTLSAVPSLLDPDNDPDLLLLKVHTMEAQDFTLPSGLSYRGNQEQVDEITNLTTSNLATSVQTSDTATRYDAVVCQGAPITYTSTFQFAIEFPGPGIPVNPLTDHDLIPSWTSVENTLYENATSNIPPPGGALPYDECDLETQRTRNLAYRRSVLPHVMTSFVLRDGDLPGGIPSTGVVTSIPGEFFNWVTARFLNYVPLLKGFDYTSGPADVQQESGTPLTDFRRPFLIYKFENVEQDGTRTVRYHNASKNSEEYSLLTRDEKGLLGVPDFSTTVVPHIHQPGVTIKPEGANARNHSHYLVDYLPDEPDGPPKETKGMTNIIDALLTATLETDGLTVGSWPFAPHQVFSGDFPFLHDQPEILYLRFGNAYRLDYINNHDTVLDVHNGELVKLNSPSPLVWLDIHNGQFSNKLTDLARIAYIWYGKYRRAMSIDISCAVGPLLPGQMLLNGVNGIEVNSICSRVAFDFVRQRTSIQTQFINPDVSQFQ